MVTVSQAKKGNKVIYVDTEGGFSPERIKQIGGEDYEKILENILILNPTTFKEQKEAFNQLLKEITTGVSLIIIDGMTMLYRLELAEAKQKDITKIKEVNSELAKQLRVLSEIARKKNIPVLVTNQTYGEYMSEEDIKSGKERRNMMVGGDILKYWSKCIIELQNNRGRRKAILKKHRSLPEKELNFEIINKGIRRKGWI